MKRREVSVTKTIKKIRNSTKNLLYFSILPNGDIVQCAELAIVAENIFNTNLSEILKSDN